MGCCVRLRGESLGIRNWLGGLLFFLFVASATIFAQLPTATILGVVKDASGAVIPDVNLTARNVDTGQTRSTTSDSNGSYRLPALPVGNYEVRAEKGGFQAGSKRTDARRRPGSGGEFHAAGRSGEQTVSVTAEAPLVNTTSGSLGGLVGEQKMADLPLNGRNYLDLTLLQTGVAEQKGANTNNVSYTGTYFSSNGATVRSNNYMLDGAMMMNLWGASAASATGTTLGVDGIKEFKVITNSFSAEYGMNMGSQMTIVSKGGTNTFHGDAFDYLRNSAMDARNFFDKSIAANNFRRLPEFQRNNFGGSFGGPIRKDKTFFYGVFEGIRQSLGITTVDNVFPAACHTVNNIVDNQACLGATSPGTTSVVSAIQPVLALIPSPNLANNQFTFPFTQPSADNYGQMRVDQTLSDKDNMFVRYTIDNTTQVQPTAYPQFWTNAASRNQFLTLAENHIFSPALLNSFRSSFSRTNLIWTLANLPGMDSPQLSMVAGLPMGDISVTGLTTIGSSGTAPRLHKQNIFTWSDDVFYTRGHHALKFGTLINRYQQEIVNGQSYTGIANFTSLTSFLGGTPNYIRALTPGSALNRAYHFSTAGFYVQDDWRVLPTLTLNLGLRYEFSTTPYEVNGRYAVIKDPTTDTAPVISPQVYQNPTMKNFSPRLGFAWDIFGNGKTALRGGFDYLYDLIAPQVGEDLLQSQIATPPFSQRLQGNNVAFTTPLVFPSNPSSLAYRPTQYYINQPALLTYNLTLEQQLPFDMVATIAYAGSGGRHLMRETEANPAIPQGIRQGGACIARPTGQAVNTASMVDNSSATACWLPGDAANFRVNSHFGSTDYFTTGGSSVYNALQFGLIKRLTKGLQIQSSYTWSKASDDNLNVTGEVLQQNNSYPTDPFNPRTDWGPSNTDITQVWKLNVLYQFPNVKSSNEVVSKLLNGWWTSGILSMQTGLAFTPDLGSNTSFSGIGGGTGGLDRPNLVAGRSISSITSGTTAGCGSGANQILGGRKLGDPSLYFDPCAFTVPTQGFLGNTGRSILRGPGFANLDFSLVKDTALRALGESGMIEFRAEIFNITNHPNFSLPNRVTYASVGATTPAANVGQILSTSATSRQVQLALKIIF